MLGRGADAGRRDRRRSDYSPLRVAGDPVDGRSDLYALGIVFYEGLSGELPFRGDSQTEALAQQLAGATAT